MRFLSQSIESVLNQDYQNWELIAVNDGSTDRSVDVIKSFKDTRVRYFEKRNGGVSSGRNLGLIHMKGDFFCFLDADDILPPTSLSSRIKEFDRNPTNTFVDGVVVKMDDEMKETVEIWNPSFQGNPFEDLVKLTGRSFFGPSWMIKKKEGINYHFQEGLTHCEDLLFYLKVSRAGGTYTFVNEEILHYRVHGSSAMSNLDGLANGYHMVFDWLQKHENGALPESYKKRANQIITRSYLRTFNLLKAFTKRIR